MSCESYNITLNRKEMEQILEKMTFDFKAEDPFKLRAEDMTRISEVYNLNNYHTYELFLKFRPDIQGEEREYYENIIKTLKEEENEAFKQFLEKINSYSSKDEQ